MRLVRRRIVQVNIENDCAKVSEEEPDDVLVTEKYVKHQRGALHPRV
jgi:hypothetical protein